MLDTQGWEAARERLKGLLDQGWRGWNQTRLAEATGKQTKQVNAYVNGRNMPPADWLLHALAVMGVDFRWFAFDEGGPEIREPAEAELLLAQIKRLLDAREGDRERMQDALDTVDAAREASARAKERDKVPPGHQDTAGGSAAG